MTRSKLRRCANGCRTLTPGGELCEACRDRETRAEQSRAACAEHLNRSGLTDLRQQLNRLKHPEDFSNE